MLDKLLPISTVVTLNAWPHETLTAYDMLNKRELPVEKADGRWKFKADLDELGGTVIALYPVPLAQMRIAAPPSLELGTENSVLIFVEEGNGLPIDGLQPLWIDIKDADGAASAYSGYYCARNGILRLPIIPGLNETPGTWHIKAEDLTAGLTAETTISYSR